MKESANLYNLEHFAFEVFRLNEVLFCKIINVETRENFVDRAAIGISNVRIFVPDFDLFLREKSDSLHKGKYLNTARHSNRLCSEYCLSVHKGFVLFGNSTGLAPIAMKLLVSLKLLSLINGQTD